MRTFGLSSISPQMAAFHASDSRFSSKAVVLVSATGGFEGLVAMAEEVQLAHSSIPDREDLKELGFVWYAAHSASPALPDCVRTRLPGASMKSSGSQTKSIHLL